MDFILETPSDIALKIARRIKNIRKRRKITQKQMATRCNVSYASYRKFEETGMIAFVSLIKVVMELGLINEINDLFTQPVYLSIEEVINDRK
jgi:transcriptional regulator with XRE-family HTH domain